MKKKLYNEENMKWFFLCSLFLFLSCPGLIQAPPAQPGSGIPIGSGDQDSSDSSDPKDSLYPGKPNAPGGSNHNNPNNPNLPLTLPSDRQWGLVSCNQSWPYTSFNKQLKIFLSTSNDPNKMKWWVKCDFTDQNFKNWKGGLFIRGKVFFQEDKFNPVSPTQNLIPIRNSYLEIHIVDHLQNTVVNPIKMQIAELSSSVSGNNVSLVFKDEKGEVTLKGTVVDKNPKNNDFTIYGEMNFLNYINYKGELKREGGFLGYFKIPACSFLDCVKHSP